jgi:hypothetical protein
MGGFYDEDGAAASDESNKGLYGTDDILKNVVSYEADRAEAAAEDAANNATFDNLDDNGDVGDGADQVAAGDHDHDLDYSDIEHDHDEVYPQSENAVFTGSMREETYAMTGTVLNPKLGTVQTKAMTVAQAFTATFVDGESMTLMLTGADTYAVTWPTATWVTSEGNVEPTLTGADVLTLWQIGATLYIASSGSFA